MENRSVEQKMTITRKKHVPILLSSIHVKCVCKSFERYRTPIRTDLMRSDLIWSELYLVVQ